jgi:NAD+ kinase
MVVSPRSVLAVEVIGVSGEAFRRPGATQADWPGAAQSETNAGVVWCDGRRSIDLAPGARVEVRRGSEPVLLARLGDGEAGQDTGAPFTDRLVAKFGLPVTGWRGRPAKRAARGEPPPRGNTAGGEEETLADA